MENLNVLKTLYENNGEVSWTTFSADQNTNKNKVVLLEQDDFADGTLRIFVPCMLKLTENINFNPNRPDMGNDGLIDPNRTLDWFPSTTKSSNDQYFQNDVKFAYGLGFFAAIAVEAENVLINLNNYVLAQHEEHYLQQRFYANIELADQPFIPFQGPSNFGSQLRSAKNCYIFNGKLGRSSHHGIHGNHVDGLYITNVEMEDFEVCGIAINGGKNITIDNVVIIKNNHNIPVLGTYSAGRFIRLFVKDIQNKGISNSNLDSAVVTLNQELDEAFNSIIFNTGDIPNVFKNNSGLIDGNAYGIVINPKGVAVGKFMEDRNSNKANETTNIVIKNTSINGIHANINEILAVANESGSAQVDTAGSLLQFFNGVSSLTNDKYYYQGTSVSDVKLELARIKNQRDDQNLDTSFFGTLNISKYMVLWKDMSSFYFKKTEDNKLKLYNANGAYIVNNQPVEFGIYGNGDTMFHVNKGVMGLRIDGANGVILENNIISDISNNGAKGSNIPGKYINSHPDQGSMVGYCGSQTFGAICSAVNDISLNNISVSSVTSANASAYGIVIQHYSSNCDIKNMIINNINSNIDGTFNPEDDVFPNQPAISRGIYVANNQTNINIENITVSNINNNNGNPYDKTYDINCNVKII